MNRREFLWNSGGAALLTAASRSFAMESEASAAGVALPPWREGYLDLHHINTGRGNATLVVMPDGTSLLVDAGAAGTTGPDMCAARPYASRRPGEWIGRYVQRQLRAAGLKLSGRLDYALVTHLHGDHVGDVTEASPASADGSYRLTGISDVAAMVGIDRLIDRSYPAYDSALLSQYRTAKNYAAFVQSAAQQGMQAERVQVGSARQIALVRQPNQYPEFGVKMLAGDGAVALSHGEGSRWVVPPKREDGPDAISAENKLSIALRLRYGKFSYFTGGDLNCDTNYGRDPWRDVETPAAQACGPVSVATCDHHGYFDACGPELVRALRPQVWVLQSWHASHPALSTLANLYSTELYPGQRDVYCVGLHPAADLACVRFTGRFKSKQGHVVVRVEPGGERFRVMVTGDGDESDRVKAIYGPYTS